MVVRNSIPLKGICAFRHVGSPPALAGGRVHDIIEYKQAKNKKVARKDITLALGCIAFLIAVVIFGIIWLPSVEEPLLEQRTQRELKNLPVQATVQERIIDRSLGNRVTYIVEKDGELFTWRPQSIERNQGFSVGDVITVRLNNLIPLAIE